MQMSLGTTFYHRDIIYTDSDIADELLRDWHSWSASYRPSLGVPRVAPYCHEHVSSRQFDDSTDASCSRLHDDQMKAVEFCVDQLTLAYRQCIGIEMLNRAAKAKVWRTSIGPIAAYSDAINAILPIMKKRGLFD
jgi:hypothetical protein